MFLESPENFRVRKAKAKSVTLLLQICFIHIFLTWTEFPFRQEVSGVYIFAFSDTAVNFLRDGPQDRSDEKPYLGCPAYSIQKEF